MLKFYFHIDSIKREIKALKQTFLTEKDSITATYIKNKSMSEQGKTDDEYVWKKFLDSKLPSDKRSQLTFSSASTRILFWLTYWPASLLWALLNDPVRRFFKWPCKKNWHTAS